MRGKKPATKKRPRAKTVSKGATPLLGPGEAAPARPARARTKQEVLQFAADIRKTAARNGARNVRLFGSVGRDDAGEMSDIDLLVDLEAGRSLIDLAKLELDLEKLLGSRVDVGTAASLRDRLRARVLAEAVPL